MGYEAKIYVTIDRTNWYWGKSKINVLTLGVAYEGEGMAIPLFWTALNKAGNATAEKHIAVIKQFIHAFGAECIAGVLADREFGSHKLFSWCNKQAIKIPFYIRIKDNALVRIPKCRGKGRHVKKIFSALDPNQQANVFLKNL